MARCLAAILVLAFLAFLAGPAAADDHDPVSSDGSRATEASGPAGWAAYRGSGSPDLSVRIGHVGPLLAPGGATGYVPEAVLGADGRRRVSKTTSFPARAIVQIVRRDRSGTWGCTGWMVSADTVVTAGHCIHPGKGGAARFYKTSSFTVIPGRNGARAPYGTCGAKRLHSVVGWTGKGLASHDYGAIRLDCRVGRKTGWFGYAPARSAVDGLKVTISGYPCDKSFGSMWRMAGKILASNGTQVGYTIDTFGCQSGSPVFRATRKGPLAVAIHAYFVSQDGVQFNAGTRVNAKVARNISAWRKAP